MGGFTNIPKLKIEDLGAENTGDRIALFNSDGELVGYQMAGSGGAFLPLSGGAMTGGIETNDYSVSIGQNITEDPLQSDGLASYVTFAGGGAVSIISRDFNEGKYCVLILKNDGIEINASPESKGIIGTTLFNKQNDPNAFAQLGDMASISETIEEISKAGLNTSYSTKPNGHQVICPNINIIYVKYGTSWKRILTTEVI